MGTSFLAGTVCNSLEAWNFFHIPCYDSQLNLIDCQQISGEQNPLNGIFFIQNLFSVFSAISRLSSGLEKIGVFTAPQTLNCTTKITTTDNLLVRIRYS